ncbi:MAG TPA: DUF5700 domain-containing putative Zn-dependent protease, partial [Thermoanaerobaculia bacterium]|nr:DUF5700 domain-containing putative Zn-dependent protease [Thermoanaerobaculia bacterium]
QNPDKFRRDVIARMRPYAPDGDFKSSLTLVAAGSSDGFSPGRGQLYVAVDYFRDDWDGLIVLAAHELYHAVQSAVLDASGVQVRINGLEGGTREATRLLLTTLKEGTGSVVGDPLTVSNPGNYNAWFAQKYRRNLDRIHQNFALFETMLFRLAKDDVTFEKLYSLGFSGGWDSPLYFVGYRIARVLEKYDGRDAIRKMWSRSPVEPFLRYAALARRNPGDRDIVPLSESTVEILNDAARAWKSSGPGAR